MFLIHRLCFTVVLLSGAAIAGCGSDAPDGQPAAQPSAAAVAQPPGAIVATFDEKIAEDTLNDSHFTIQIVADSLTATNGSYDMHVNYGYATAISRFDMPYGIEGGQPALRRGDSAHVVLAGFRMAGDTVFHEMLRISGSRTSIRIQKVKHYRLR